MNRPSHLPDYKKPPLNEVVLGIQFTPPAGYQQIMAGEVWGLFKKDFPKVEELPPILPMFETFGLPGPPQIGFDITSSAQHNRFWFVSEQGGELIQFQNDRIHHNWRKIEGQNNEYPRFEKMIEKFSQETQSFERYVATITTQALNISQCEICYINEIYLKDTGPLASAQGWLKFLDFHTPPDDLSVTFRTVIKGDDGKPRGRLICGAASAIGTNGKQMLVLSITARGAPSKATIEGTLEFIKSGREKIIHLFTDVTTDEAHKEWERVVK